MDPVTAVGLAASIGQLITGTTKALGWLNEVRKAPRERATLAMELTSLLVLLTTLRYKFEECKPNGAWFSAARFLGVENGPLDQLSTAIDDLQKKLQPVNGFKKVKSALTWPYTNKEVQSLLSRIERFKGLINLAFQKDISDLVLAIKADTEINSHINEEVKDLAEKIELMRELQDSAAHRSEQKRLLKERQQIIEWISPLNFLPIQEDVYKRRLEGTCNWLLESKPFVKWTQTSGSVLWCPGIPGAGKTVFTYGSPMVVTPADILASSVAVNHLRRMFRKYDSTGIAVIYCNYKEESTHTLTNLLAGLWRQFVEGDKNLASTIKLSYKTHKSRQTSLGSSEIASELALEVRRYRKCFILVDALDECSESGNTRWRLVQTLRSFLPRINLMFTSRPYDSIRSQLQHSLELEIRASTDDVAKYVRDRIIMENRLRRHIEKDPALGEEIVAKVSANAEKMFLLPQLQMDSLAYQGTRRALENALARLPQELDRIYDEAMLRIETQHQYDRELAFRIISFISFARRPLKKQELQQALAIESGDKDLDEKNIPDEELLTSVCAGLVVVDAVNDTFLPIHYTTQEYFDRIRNLRFPLAQRDITDVCLTCLSFRYLRQQVLLDYAAFCWKDHYESNVPVHKDTDELLWAFLQKPVNISVAIEASRMQNYKYCIPPGASGLQVAIIVKHVEFVKRFLKSGTNIDYTDDWTQTALHIAVEFSSDEIAQALLASSPDVNKKNIWGIAPLHLAAGRGKFSLSQQLLQCGAHPELKDYHGQSVLHYAAKGGSAKLVEWLIEQHCLNTNETDSNGKTPLHYAILSGQKEVMHMLIKHGASPKAREVDDRLSYQSEKRQGRNAMHFAAENADSDLISILLQTESDVEARDGDGLTALEIAVQQNNLKTAEALLKSNCRYGSGLFCTAAGLESCKMMELLLRCCGDADINAPGPNGNSALCIAAGRPNTVRLLLHERPNIDINQAGIYCKSPLHLAVEAGSSESAQILIDAGANVEQVNHYSETPLHRAAESGYASIVGQLLAAGANIHAQDADGETPLHRAAYAEKTRVVFALLERPGAQVDIEDHNGITPLQRAKMTGNRKLVRMLAQHSSNGHKAV